MVIGNDSDTRRQGGGDAMTSASQGRTKMDATPTDAIKVAATARGPR
jgi:hypothetical protein